MKWLGFVLVWSLIVAGNNGAQWSHNLSDGQQIISCVDSTLSLPWTLDLGAGETITQVQWYFRGQSEEIIGLLTHDHFVVMPAFAQRVTQVGNVGIEVSNLTAGDSGEFLVEVTGEDAAGDLFALQETVYVNVTDGSVTSDGNLRVQLQSTPVYESTSQGWVVKLTCGHFPYTDPPFDVIWTLPDGQTAQSSAYDAGSFQYFIHPSFAAGSDGTYSCQVPSAMACGSVLEKANVTVDEMTMRLAVLEAGQMALSAENSQLAARLEMERTNLTAQIHQLKDVTVPALTALVNNLTRQLQDVSPATRQQISFLARPHSAVNRGAHLVFDDVVSNHGNAYSATTGDFTAPVAGTYFFATSTRCSYATEDVTANVDLRSSSSGGTLLCRIDSHVEQDAGSCQAVAHLARGERVWLQAHGQRVCYRQDASVFTGFLVAEDP